MIEIRHLYKSYGVDRLYEDFNMVIEKGKITSILGPSGCGKTTLLRMIAGLEGYQIGEIIGTRDMTLAMIFQEDRLLPWLSVYDNLDFILKSKYTKDEREEKILNILKLLELEAYKDYMPKALSGGMKRRVAMGRAFVYDADLIIMDEPFKGLDDSLRKQLLIMLKKIWEVGRQTIIMVTHNEEEAKFISQNIYRFSSKPVTYKRLKW